MTYEKLLKKALVELHKRQFQQFDNIPEHVFSEEHQQAMERIFDLFDENCKKMENKTNLYDLS